ncbi:DUF1742-domain-containing protein [Coprinopsis marcescibilis]|uniref:DUF1742-domain-containing protein n=1 Tax=Coprinopsis marcescibilis TaxID=230819 RepID=A0A5C3L8Y2_COPMA|nr:DUF1742-domain-containing protein [Coprinopsis marcescibilis]
MSFANIYYKRAVATPKACYVCYRPTTTVLATINTLDFLYTCPSHLTDTNFASRIPDENTAKPGPSVSPEEIDKIKKEWEEKQKMKEEKEKEKAKNAEKDKEKEKSKADDGGESSKAGSKSALPEATSPGATTPAKPVHERYSLHRDFYAMRQSEHRKRRQAAQARELAPRLPGAPTGAIFSSTENKY